MNLIATAAMRTHSTPAYAMANTFNATSSAAKDKGGPRAATTTTEAHEPRVSSQCVSST